MAKKREMQERALQGNKPNKSTQQYLDISEIRDDIVILKNGSLRAVLMCSSINFALKSEDEQNAVIAAYVQFLNSLDFPIQVVVQSRRLNIDSYIEELRERERKLKNELLRIQLSEYIAYIQELLELGEIMSKKFYVVVPYNPGGELNRSFWSRMTDAFTLATKIKLKSEQFLKYKAQLSRRIDLVAGGLSSMGLSVVLLDTQSLIELYYQTYNPNTSGHQHLADLEKIRISPEL